VRKTYDGFQQVYNARQCFFTTRALFTRAVFTANTGRKSAPVHTAREHGACEPALMKDILINSTFRFYIFAQCLQYHDLLRQN